MLIPLKDEIDDSNLGLILSLSIGVVVEIGMWGIFFV